MDLSLLCVIISMFEQPGLKCYSLGDNLLRRLVESVMCVKSIGLSTDVFCCYPTPITATYICKTWGWCVCCSGSVIAHSLTGRHIFMPLFETDKYRLLDITIYSIDMVFKTWYLHTTNKDQEMEIFKNRSTYNTDCIIKCSCSWGKSTNSQLQYS